MLPIATKKAAAAARAAQGIERSVVEARPGRERKRAIPIRVFPCVSVFKVGKKKSRYPSAIYYILYRR